MKSIAPIALAGIAISGTAAAQPAPTLMPINALDGAARSYVAQNGSIIANAGVNSPGDLIGRAVLCRVENRRFVLEPQAAYPIAGATKYIADSGARPEPLSLLAQGTLSGNLTVGPLSTNASDDQLTRLDITETGRLSIDLTDGEANLNRTALMRLHGLAGNIPTGSTYTHWCVIRSVSSWTVRYEGYARRGFNANVSGVWIASGGAAYSRNVSSVVPYSVLTVAISPFAVTWIKEQAERLLSSPIPTSPVTPPPAVLGVSAIQGTISRDALARGDRAADMLLGRATDAD